VSISSVEKIYKVNLIGCLMVLRLAIPCLEKSIAPLIINLSSRLGSIDLRGETQLGGAIAYQCSKAALNMLTKQAAIDLKPLKIRVISQSPGWVKTEMGGVKAKYQVSEAVSMMLHSLNQLPSDQTGVFIGEDGKEIPW
jgi:NAD(P)-dependent dehydrogenase (short-subunit alcohol dehydrogenase family)